MSAVMRSYGMLLRSLLAGLALTAVGCKDTMASSATAIDPKATVRFVTPGYGDVAPLVKAQMTKSAAENRRVLVYTGAPWCEPCKAFHHAVDTGQLTGKVGALDVMGFDSEADAERMLMAGYESQMIPLFAIPGPDGRASGKQMEGGIKGDGAVADFIPRLQALLASAK